MGVVEKLGDWSTSLMSWAARRRIDEIAGTIALRREVLREIVQLRTEEYVRAGKIDDLTGLGIARRVAEEMESKFDWAKREPRSEDVRAAIVRAVTLKAVKPITWLILRELSRAGEFSGRGRVFYEVHEDSGAKLGGGTMVFRLSEEFLFHKPIAYLDMERARVTAEALSLAEERLIGSNFTVDSFSIT